MSQLLYYQGNGVCGPYARVCCVVRVVGYDQVCCVLKIVGYAKLCCVVLVVAEYARVCCEVCCEVVKSVPVKEVGLRKRKSSLEYHVKLLMAVLQVYYAANGTYSAFLLTRFVQDLIEKQNDSEPLFVYLPYQSVHGPLQVPHDYVTK